MQVQVVLLREAATLLEMLLEAVVIRGVAQLN